MSKDDVSLDDELLLVTEKKKGVQKKSSKDKSSVRDDEEGDGSESGEESDHKGGKRKPKTTTKKQPLKKRKTGDSSGESSDDERYDDGWGSDLMGDDEDRAKLNAMPEIERENILSERYTKRKELQDGWAIKKRLREEQRAKEKREGKKDGDSKRDVSKDSKDNKDREKRDTRVVQKAQTSKNKALSELKKKRAKAGYKHDSDDEDAEDGEVEDTKDDDDDYAPKGSSSDRRDDSHAAKSDSEDDSENVVIHYSQDQGHPLTFEEVEQLRLSRETLEKWLDKPFFSNLIPGFFVRIGIGMDPATRMNVYRVAQVKEVVNKTSYLISGKQTTKWLKLLIADKDKDFKMETISNRPFTESEYKHWKSQMERAGISLPTSNQIPSKLETLAAAKNYRYTNEDIQKMLEEKKNAGTLPISVAAEKARLVTLRDAELDPVEKEKLDAEIARLEEMGKEKHSKRIVTQSVAKINQRNKDSNFKTTLESQTEVRAGNSDTDPFSRRRTVPNIVYASKYKVEDQPEATTPPPTTPPQTNGTSNNNNNNNGTTATAITTTNTNPLKVSAGLPSPKTTEHDFIDIDISALSSTPSAHPLPPHPILHTPSTHNIPPEKKPKSTLSLDDYMRRRNAMQ